MTSIGMATSELDQTYIENVQNLFNDPSWSDLTVKCGDRQWFVHKTIVCTSSEWFAKALKHGTKEAKTNVIILREIQPIVAEVVLRHLYFFGYPSYSNDLQWRAPLILHVHVHIAAGFLGLGSLDHVALRRFMDRCETEMRSKDLADAISVVYTSVPDRDRVLRDAVLELCVKHGKELLGDGDGANPHLKEVLNAIPGFGGELATKLVTSKPDTISGIFWCGACEEEYHEAHPYEIAAVGTAVICKFCGFEIFSN